MIKWKNINWLFIATGFTVVYFAIFFLWIGFDRVTKYPTTASLNEIGDFLAGGFQPIAVIWLVAAVLTQRQELVDTRDQFQKNSEIVDAQLVTIKEQSALLQQQHALAEDTADRTYRLSLFEQRFAIYNTLVALHAKFEVNGITTGNWNALHTEVQKSGFVFGDEVQEYLEDIDQKCVELFFFHETNAASWAVDHVYGGDHPSDDVHVQTRFKAEAMKLEIISLLSSQALKEAMWESMHVSDD
ncbi:MULTISPECIES: hypothetical protein [unclassified Rhizobium]|uniref:hypothetical protein n=1 Tax=unclassified Rhizobium TaxID=2613769 RepID=UPI0028895AC7|nr:MULTISPECIES: hypothetical protein [unclassified Rhizobium]